MKLEYIPSEELQKGHEKEKIKQLLSNRFWWQNDAELISYFKSLDKKSKAIDFGAGSGHLLKLLNENGFSDLTAVDIYNYLDDSISKKANFVQANLTADKLPFKNETFDVAFCLEVIEHLENPYFFVREVSRVLKKNGIFIAAFPNSISIFNRLKFLFDGDPSNYNFGDNHIFLVSKSIFSKLFSDFTVEKVFPSEGVIPKLRIKLPFKSRYFSPKIAYVMRKR